jgi:hypothetical protein
LLTHAGVNRAAVWSQLLAAPSQGWYHGGVVVTPGLHIAAWVVITLIALRLLQLLAAKSTNPLAQSLGQGITFAIGH